MNPERAMLDALIESVADGSPVDWQGLYTAAPDEDARRRLRHLRLVAGIAEVHRTQPDEEQPDSLTPILPSDHGGARWGHLLLLEKLGEGTFGEVYHARDSWLDREVALKLLKPATANDVPMSRVLREARTLARVRHPHVVVVHGADVHGGRVGLWMEFLRGRTLEEMLALQGPFGAGEAGVIGQEICRALAAVHASGLVHRDVKAQNVMREDGGRIVLMDLGTGSDSGARHHVVADRAGTPLYLAPEIFQGAQASVRTDLYSVGVLLYHLVTGSYPVRATTIEELQEAHASGKVVRLRDARADLPTAFVAVVDRAIASDADQRYATVGELESDLVKAAAPALTRTQRTSFIWRIGIFAAALAAIVVVVVGMWLLLRERHAPSAVPGPIRSIAVLPLVNESGDPAQEYFADGMTDELIGTLGQLEGVNVISRTSAMRFKGSKASLPEIAGALHVDAVLEGSVLVLPGNHREDPNDAKRVRINARLYYAGTDTQLWEKGFERVVANVLTLQSEVAKAVTDGIHLQLTSQQQRLLTPKAGAHGRASERVNPQAYEAYLRGRYLWNKRTPENLRKALDEFKKSVDLDPTSALAWSGLADGYNLLADDGDEPAREVKPLAKAAAKKALELDDALAEAHAALAELEWNYEWDLKTAEKEFERALALNPNYASAHLWRGLSFNWAGRFDEALAEMKRAQELDPLSPGILVNIARCHMYAHRYDKGVEILEQLRQREPDSWALHAVLGQIHLAQNRFADAIRELLRARELSPSSLRNLGVLGDVYARAGRRLDAWKLLGELSEVSRRRYVPPVYPAMIYMGLGDKRKALDLLDQAYVDRSDWILQINVEPEFDPLRNEPRFQEIVRRASSTPDR